MVSRRVINVTGGVLAEKIVQEFGRSLRGKSIRPGDEGTTGIWLTLAASDTG